MSRASTIRPSGVTGNFDIEEIELLTAVVLVPGMHNEVFMLAKLPTFFTEWRGPSAAVASVACLRGTSG